MRPTLAQTLAGIGDADPLPPAPRSGWEETQLLAAAMTQDPEAFVAALAEHNLPLAGHCAARPRDGREDPDNDEGRRVVRGGSWFYPRDNLRAPCRNHGRPGVRGDDLGCRLLCSSPSP